MTSGNFSIVPTASITIDREGRQRRELDPKHIADLAESIRRRGLINPITVTRDLVLVAGECRLTAHRELRFDSIAVQYIEDLPEEEVRLIELEENVKRKNLEWQDEVRAVQSFHKIKKEIEPEWTTEKTAEELGMSKPNAIDYMHVAQALDNGVKEVVEAPKFSVAKNFTKRLAERQKTAAKRELLNLDEPTSPPAEGEIIDPSTPPKPRRFADIQQADFLVWCQDVQQQPYNVIHCDFPYGVRAGNKSGQSAAKSFGGYDDEREVYFTLLNAFLHYQDNFVSPSAHMLFWFSMNYYQETIDAIRAAEWRVDPFPLIWHRSDNSGILPDPNRGPRRTYETALFCTRGDRKIVKAVANSFANPATKEYHMSEKPLSVVEHFFRMIVDETAWVLDPTAGSGMAIKAAEAAGAGWSLGLELNKEYVEAARQNLKLED